ncbi:MAG: FapA family protein [Candidatus Cloacimonetes bacterium]|nr:FapA family protein [Candidatus Cloacimonadota bacterium]
MKENIIGKIEFKFSNQESVLHIQKLYPYLENGEEISLNYLKSLIETLNLRTEVNYNILDYYIKEAISKGIVLNDVFVSSGKTALKKNSSHITFTNKEFSIDTLDKWSFYNYLFSNMQLPDMTKKIPIPLYFIKKGEIIAKLQILNEAINGTSITGESIIAGRFQNLDFKSGENVHYDEAKKSFIAGACGFVMFKDNAISVVPPFFVTEDKMQLYFINMERQPLYNIEKQDIATFLLKQKIHRKSLVKNFNLDLEPGRPILLAEGKQPSKGQDAKIEFLVDIVSKHQQKDENDKMDYREVKQFPSIGANEALAKKILAIPGENGYDIYDNVIPAANPKDLILKNGPNTYKEENDKEIIIYSKEDGLIEFKNNIISVFPQLNISGDIDFSTGNINTKVNVHINGNVKTGFKIISEKNVFIKGIIEDNCQIEAGGDLIINGGSPGANTNITCQGNMSVKFIEGGNIFVKGKLSVQRFILAANIECLDTITVMGAGINLNEKGAIIDCNIKIKKALFCPTVGNDTGIKTYINFGYDRSILNKIANLDETINKIKQSIDELKARFEDDISSPNIFNLIKNYAKSVKDEVIQAIQEKNKLDNQLQMMTKIYEKELDNKKQIIAEASVQISNKVFPTLALECDSIKKIIDTLQPPSKYYLDLETRWIERGSYLTNKL